MKTIVTPEEVISIAFSSDYVITASKIMPLDILVAESRFLMPIVGEPLYQKLLEGDYPQFVADYVAPQVAAWTRYLVEPLLGERCDYDRSRDYSEADFEMNRLLLNRLKSTAQALSRRMTDYLNANATAMPEYNAEANPMNHCVIYGDIIQVY